MVSHVHQAERVLREEFSVVPMLMLPLLAIVVFAGTDVATSRPAAADRPWFSNETGTTTIERIVVFGDSLQDTGNLYKINANVAPAWAHYNNGRFTDDLVASEYLRNRLEAESQRKLVYINHAYGGALLKGNRVGIPGQDGMGPHARVGALHRYIDFINHRIRSAAAASNRGGVNVMVVDAASLLASVYQNHGVMPNGYKFAYLDCKGVGSKC